MTSHKQEQGFAAERAVAHELTHNGFTILEYNYTTRLGEVDIIARSSELVIFVEVKMRHHALFDLSTVITPSKQKKIIASAKVYLSQHEELFNCACRFDVALVEYQDNLPTITYLPHAFVEP